MTLTQPVPRVPESARGHLLEVDRLSVEFRTDYGTVNAVNEVSWHLDEGETLAILGESGSGKSVSAQAIMGIIDSPPGFITGGSIRFRDRDILTMTPDEELMDRVRIPKAKGRVRDYPHQFSGGMRQRVMMAMALALDPAVLIADEPTTALDVTVQAQIMDLLLELQRETGMGVVLITHDLGVVGEVADRIAVMYAGRVVETGTVHDVFSHPAMPYTVGLMNSVPRVDQRGQRLSPIVGAPPNLAAIPSGCSFNPRCPRREHVCTVERPLLRDVAPGRRSACHFAEEVLDA